ncbi:MAG: DndE family protein [Nitrosopumilaceae archaeon]
MKISRLSLSHRSQNLLGQIKTKTGLTANVSGRFAICLSLKDPSTPNPDEFDERGAEIHPQVLFGEYQNLFVALLLQRLKEANLDPEIYFNKMLRAHFNRGVISLFSRVNDISDINEMVKQERLQ